MIGATRLAAAEPAAMQWKPYRWRGIPGWDPGAVLRDRPARAHPCPKCRAPVGEGCRVMRDGVPGRYGGFEHAERKALA